MYVDAVEVQEEEKEVNDLCLYYETRAAQPHHSDTVRAPGGLYEGRLRKKRVANTANCG